MKTSTMTLTLSLSVAATLLLSLSVAANAENYFNRIASFPTYQNIPAEEDPPPPQATLIPSTYTESEATALVVK